MRRAPVQGVGAWRLPVRHPARRPGDRRPGTIAWEEHAEAWTAYRDRYNNGQTAERMAERGGFGYDELVDFLGHEPTTWERRAEDAGR